MFDPHELVERSDFALASPEALNRAHTREYLQFLKELEQQVGLPRPPARARARACRCGGSPRARECGCWRRGGVAAAPRRRTRRSSDGGAVV